jgi:hypothetical protein
MAIILHINLFVAFFIGFGSICGLCLVIMIGQWVFTRPRHTFSVTWFFTLLVLGAGAIWASTV